GKIENITGGDITDDSKKGKIGMYIENSDTIGYVLTGSNSHNIIDNEGGHLTLETGKGNESIIIAGQKGVSIQGGNGKAYLTLYNKYTGTAMKVTYDGTEAAKKGIEQLLKDKWAFDKPEGMGNPTFKNEANYNINEWWKNSLSDKYGVSDYDAAMRRNLYGVGNDNNFAAGLYSALPKAVQIKIDDWKEKYKSLAISNPDLYNTKYADQVLNYYDATKDYVDVLNLMGNAVESKDYLALGALLFVGGGITNSSNIELKDKMVLKTNVALNEASEFLGEGYVDKGNGIFVSKNGTRRVRMTDSDIASPNSHADGPHFNFETGKTVINRNGRESFVPKINLHIYLSDK
ncbi:MAG: hypothetical protein ACYDG2_24275, partial [Ruminiclostridium sp.]